MPDERAGPEEGHDDRPREDPRPEEGPAAEPDPGPEPGPGISPASGSAGGAGAAGDIASGDTSAGDTVAGGTAAGDPAGDENRPDGGPAEDRPAEDRSTDAPVTEEQPVEEPDGGDQDPADRGAQDREPAGEPRDDDAVWAQLVAAFGQEPSADRLWPDAENLDSGRTRGEDGASTRAREHRRIDEPGDQEPAGDGTDAEQADREGGAGSGFNTTRSILVQPGPLPRHPAPGPRDHTPPEDEDEGHFVPPPPPPLPQLDTTTKFAWLAALGGPLLLLGLVVFRQPIAWWAVLLGVGGFLGGFGTLVVRMPDRDEEDEDPHGGAIV